MSALRRTESARPVALEARVSNPDPDELTVTIEDFDGDQFTRHAWPVIAWPRSATAVPARGDRCLVVTSEIGQVWVVAAEWTGQALRWRRLDLRTGWGAHADSASPGEYAKSPGGWVALRGIVRKSGSRGGGEELLVPERGELPEDCRPPVRLRFPVLVGGDVAAWIEVRPDGQLVTGAVSDEAAAGAGWTLDGIGYWAED